MFCLNYYPNQKYIEEADQLKIKYKPADRTLVDFLEVYKKKSIVIDVNDIFVKQDAALFSELCKKYPKVKLIVDFYNKEALELIEQYDIPHFFSNSVTSIDQMQGLLAYHPTDMYICEELGFFLDKISEILHKNHVKVRVYPNICQSSWAETPSLKTFFIRPNDIPIYSTFVDVFELISDKERQHVIFKIYKQEKWMGPISEIIPTFKHDLDNKYILSSFGKIRSKCGKRCMYKPGSCNICERFAELGKTLEKSHIIIRSMKKKD